MSGLIFTGNGDAAGDRLVVDRARRYAAWQDASPRSGPAPKGVRKLVERVYTLDLGTPTDQILLRNVWEVIANLYPGMVVSGRSALARKPLAQGGDGPRYVFLTGGYRRNISLPGLEIRIAKGAGPLPGDEFHRGVYIASPERHCLENLVPSRARDGVARTTGSEAVAGFLDRMMRVHGAAEVEELLERADAIRPYLEADGEMAELRRLADAVLHTREIAAGSISREQVAQRYEGVDEHFTARLDKLWAFLSRTDLPRIKDAARDPDADRNAAMMESFFSNLIEGVDFEVEEAVGILTGRYDARDRVADARDLAATMEQVSAPEWFRATPEGFDDFVGDIQARHGRLMSGRPGVRPGRFKTEPNQAGGTGFVAPLDVRGTLRHGHGMISGLVHPLARAIFVHCLIAEVHPFVDGNGRLARIMMTAELKAAGLSRIVVPLVAKGDYISALRQLSLRASCDPIVGFLARCQAVTAAISEPDMERCIETWATTHAFLAPEPDLALILPTRELVERRNGVPAPASYWDAQGLDRPHP